VVILRAGAALLAFFTLVLFLARIPSSTGLTAPPTPRLDLPAGVSVRPASLGVRVVTEAGHPVEGATVAVHWTDALRHRLAGTGRTDQSGQARVEDLPLGAVWVLVSAPARARRSTTLVLTAPGERAISVALPSERRLTVTVRDEASRPIAGATVLVHETDPLPHAALSDASGAAALSRLGPPPYRVRVAARGYEPEVRSEVIQDVPVTLKKASALEVYVKDSEGKPVEKATVSVAGPSLFPPVRVETGPDGKARLAGLAPGSVAVRAEEGGRVSRV
jgi:hypothetical protein